LVYLSGGEPKQNTTRKGTIRGRFVGKKQSPANGVQATQSRSAVNRAGCVSALDCAFDGVLFFILSREHVRFMAEAILSIFNDLALLSLVFYFVWRNEEPIQHIGWTFNNFRKEITGG
jgi:hypothetical protein